MRQESSRSLSVVVVGGDMDFWLSLRWPEIVMGSLLCHILKLFYQDSIAHWEIVHSVYSFFFRHLVYNSVLLSFLSLSLYWIQFQQLFYFFLFLSLNSSHGIWGDEWPLLPHSPETFSIGILEVLCYMVFNISCKGFFDKVRSYYQVYSFPFIYIRSMGFWCFLVTCVHTYQNG